MIITTFNIRGLGGGHKKRKIRELVRQNNVDFLAIQETKMEAITHSLCCNLWGSDDCEWAFLPSEGASGGILSLWSKSNSSFISSFNGEGCLGVCLEWGPLKYKCIIVNIYSKCDLEAKKRLWNNLLAMKRVYGDAAWCILGDFNAVRSRDERRGVNLIPSPNQDLESYFFNLFLVEIELEDLNVLGRRFTWFQSNGRAMGRIDRVLISKEWSNL